MASVVPLKSCGVNYPRKCMLEQFVNCRDLYSNFKEFPVLGKKQQAKGRAAPGSRANNDSEKTPLGPVLGNVISQDRYLFNSFSFVCF